MYHRYPTFAFCGIALFVAVIPALAQSPAPQAPPPRPSPPPVRRWLDVQSLLGAARYRFTGNSAGRETVNDLQWQTQFRGRFLFDDAGRKT